MDDENLHQEGYFEAFCTVVNSLDPKAADFEFMLGNLRIGARSSPFMTDDEKKKAQALLHLVSMRVKEGGGA